MPIYFDAETQRYYARVWHKNRAHTGPRRETRREAVADEHDLRQTLKNPPADRSPVPSVWRFCVDEYLPHAKLRLSASWRRNQNYTLVTIGERLDVPLTAVTTARMEEYMRSRLADGIAEVSVNNELRILRRLLSFAKERGHIDEVPPCPPLPVAEQRVKCWSLAEIERLLESCAMKAPAILPLVAFLANTGCRRGEAVALRWESVDLARRLVRIEPGNGWAPKSRRAREVPINDALLPWLQLPRRSEYVFPSRKGTRYADWPARDWGVAEKAAGLKGGVHTLRHSYASHFLAARPDLPQLGYIMGHSDAAVTRLYAHMLPDHLERAREAVSFVAPAAAADAVAMVRWRIGRETVRKPSGGGGEKCVSTERGTRFELATSSLGSLRDRDKMLKVLKR